MSMKRMFDEFEKWCADNGVSTERETVDLSIMQYKEDATRLLAKCWVGSRRSLEPSEIRPILQSRVTSGRFIELIGMWTVGNFNAAEDLP